MTAKIASSAPISTASWLQAQWDLSRLEVKLLQLALSHCAMGDEHIRAVSWAMAGIDKPAPWPFVKSDTPGSNLRLVPPNLQDD